MNESPITGVRIEVQGGVQAVLRAVLDEVAAARARGDRRVLLDLRALQLRMPTLAQRDAAITEWARASGGDLVVAVVAPPALIDPQKYGVMLAAAHGLRAEVFEDEAPARAWLARQAGPIDIGPGVRT